ncbi:MAG: hypothetical protein AAF724_03305 [Pseudomonadota bacterium]
MADEYFSYDVVEEIKDKDSFPVRFYRRNRKKEPRNRRFTENDFREVLSLAATAAVTPLPSRYWSKYSRFASGLRYRRQRQKKFAGFEAAVRSVFGIEDKDKTETLFRSHLEMVQRRRMMLTIDRLAPRRNPHIDFIGAEALNAALEQGHGAIIWAFPFNFQTLAGKRALWEQGFRPNQISAGIHGFSGTNFANRTINPILRRAEDRYLNQRITFERDAGASLTRRIIGLLDRGELILITNNLYAGSMFAEMHFGQDSFVSMPTTPLSIVSRRSTPLFSMAIFETAPYERLEAVVRPINIGPRIDSKNKTLGRDYNQIAQLALLVRDNLFEHCLRAPDQYLTLQSFTRSRFEEN